MGATLFRSRLLVCVLPIVLIAILPALQTRRDCLEWVFQACLL